MNECLFMHLCVQNYKVILSEWEILMKKKNGMTI